MHQGPVKITVPKCQRPKGNVAHVAIHATGNCR
jgi:hypothetical protein